MNVYGSINATQMRIEVGMMRCKKAHYGSHKMNPLLVNRTKVHVWAPYGQHCTKTFH
jgi:hypothetical protein